MTGKPVLTIEDHTRTLRQVADRLEEGGKPAYELYLLLGPADIVFKAPRYKELQDRYPELFERGPIDPNKPSKGVS